MKEHENQEAQRPIAKSAGTRRGFWPGFGAGIGTILLLVLGAIVLIAAICAIAMTRGCGMNGDMMDDGMMGAASAPEAANSVASVGVRAVEE